MAQVSPYKRVQNKKKRQGDVIKKKKKGRGAGLLVGKDSWKNQNLREKTEKSSLTH